jgi:DNA-directed RNA polymerase specialized sigma24 family protein
MCSIENINDKATKKAFDKRVISATQEIHPYVKHRLYIAESTGILPKKMYTSNGIIDEAIAKYYEKGYNVDSDVNTIKLKLFKIVVNDLNNLYKKEDFHKNTISTNSVLEEELDDLEEHYTMNADWDFVMNEELNDISYKQDHKHKHLFLYDDNNSSVLSAFEAEDIEPNRSKQILGSLYSWLPIHVSSVIDLIVFGKLSFEEIAKVKSIEVSRVEFIYEEVKKQFKDHLD